MKRRIAAGVLAVICACGAVGCGGTSSPTGSLPAASGTEATASPPAAAGTAVPQQTPLTDPGGIFQPTGQMAEARACHTATLLRDGRVLLVGGYGRGSEEIFYICGGSSGQATASAELFDPRTGRFTPTGSMATPRVGHTATLLADGRVLVTGGRAGDDGEGSLATAELYDPATGRFTPTGSMSTAREAHVAVLLSDGRVFVTGGSDGESEVFDPRAGTFTPAGMACPPRTDALATLLPDGRILYVGGTSWGGSSVPRSAVLCDPRAGTYGLATAEREIRRSAFSLTALADGRVLLAGGEHEPAAAEIYDPRADAFSATGPFLIGRTGGSATLLADGRVLVTGGMNADGFGILRSSELYDPDLDRFERAGAMNEPRDLFTATLLADGRVLVAGGSQGGGPLASAELFDPTAGEPAEPAPLAALPPEAVVQLTLPTAWRWVWNQGLVDAVAETLDPERAAALRGSSYPTWRSTFVAVDTASRPIAGLPSLTQLVVAWRSVPGPTMENAAGCGLFALAEAAGTCAPELVTVRAGPALRVVEQGGDPPNEISAEIYDFLLQDEEQGYWNVSLFLLTSLAEADRESAIVRQALETLRLDLDGTQVVPWVTGSPATPPDS